MRGDLLDCTPELELGLEEPVAFAAVFAGLAGKTNVRVYWQRGSV